MKLAVFTLALVMSAAPAHAQLGGLGSKVRKANDAADKVQKVKDLKISDADERKRTRLKQFAGASASREGDQEPRAGRL